MSIIYKNDYGWFISHEVYIKYIYKSVQTESGLKAFQLNSDVFKINGIFRKKHNFKLKRSEEGQARLSYLKNSIDFVQHSYKLFKHVLQVENIFESSCNDEEKNTKALEAAENVYTKSGRSRISNAHGSNDGPSKLVVINNEEYLFPEDSKFYCKNVSEIETVLKDVKYDLILLDPPWWNKYIRRKRKKCDNAYQMMYNADLKKIPIENLLESDGLVAVWCTNSLQHINELKNDLFPSWGLTAIAEFYWLKVTRSGEPICDFSPPPGKQPFERIIFGCKNPNLYSNFPDNKLVISVPSALHSHKPPLIELLKAHLPNHAKCLEIFARYLLPNWTSWGFETLRFQHIDCYEVD